MNRVLLRDDIVGRRLMGVLQSPWARENEVEFCHAFAALDSNVLFQLNGIEDALHPKSVHTVDSEKYEFIPADLGSNESIYVGHVIAEVVVCDTLPFFSLALLLENDFVVCYDSYAPYVIGPMLVSRDYFHGNLFAYWGHIPVH